MKRPCDTCIHLRRDPERCYHPDVRLVGIRVSLPAERTCEEWSDAPADEDPGQTGETR